MPTVQEQLFEDLSTLQPSKALAQSTIATRTSPSRQAVSLCAFVPQERGAFPPQGSCSFASGRRGL